MPHKGTLSNPANKFFNKFLIAYHLLDIRAMIWIKGDKIPYFQGDSSLSRVLLITTINSATQNIQEARQTQPQRPSNTI